MKVKRISRVQGQDKGKQPLPHVPRPLPLPFIFVSAPLRSIIFTLFAIFVANYYYPVVTFASSLSHLKEALMEQEQEGVIKRKNENFEILTPKDREEFENLLKEVLGVSLFEKKEKVSPKILKQKWKTKPAKRSIRVYATSFGKPGNKGEARHFKDGSKVRWGIVAVALPDPSAIGKWVEVRRADKNGKRSKWIKMKVKDLGPWFRDDPYWKRRSKKPRAVRYFEKGKRRFDGRVVVNPAGIDITPWGWQKMGVPANKSYNHSQHVEWRFTG